LIMIELKEYSEAIRKLNQILEKAPNSDKIIFYLAAIYEETRNTDLAINYFQKIPPSSTYYPESILHSSYLLKSKGETDKAIQVVEAAIENRPDNPQFYILYASYSNDLKEYKKAEVILSQGVEKIPENPQLHFYLGTVQDRLGRLGDTINSMKKVIELDSNHVQALNYLAYTYAENNQKLDEAEAMARKANTIKPEDGYILDTLGWVLFKKGDIDLAVKTLETAFQKQSKESIIAEHLGDAYLKFQLPEQAKKMYRHATEIESDAKKVQAILEKIKAIDSAGYAKHPAKEPQRGIASEKNK